jgi:DNA-binding transcriptional ArsR family regulator
MERTSEEAILLAIANRETLFDILSEVISTDDRMAIFASTVVGKTQGEIAEEADVGQSAVSEAMGDLQESGLVEEVDDGYRKTLPCLDHPLFLRLFEEEVLADE